MSRQGDSFWGVVVVVATGVAVIVVLIWLAALLDFLSFITGAPK